MQPSIAGINHITLATKNLVDSLAFYTDILGCRLMAEWNYGAYLTAGSLWLCLTLDKQTRSAPLPEYTHLAFHVKQNDFSVITERIKKSGAVIWQENSSEGDSLYFLDPDYHKLEIHSSNLATRLASCKLTPYTGMVFFDE